MLMRQAEEGAERLVYEQEKRQRSEEASRRAKQRVEQSKELTNVAQEKLAKQRFDARFDMVATWKLNESVANMSLPDLKQALTASGISNTPRSVKRWRCARRLRVRCS
jgi:hypothetical protein